MRSAMVMTCLLLGGCQTDFMGYGGAISTTSPSAEAVAYCREVMYINKNLDIEPLGYFLQPGLDDEIRFKFIAKTNDPSVLFDAAQVDPTKFSPNFSIAALHPKTTEKWWDISSQSLFGGNFTVPPPKAQGTRGLNIGYAKNKDGTLTVYVQWHET